MDGWIGGTWHDGMDGHMGEPFASVYTRKIGWNRAVDDVMGETNLEYWQGKVKESHSNIACRLEMRSNDDDGRAGRKDRSPGHTCGRHPVVAK